MAFGRSGNRHDVWLRFCDRHRAVLGAAGLPDAVVRGEDRFRELLRDGSTSVAGLSASLVGLTPVQWSALVRFTEIFFPEFASYAPMDLFPAFRRELERRTTVEIPSPHAHRP